MCNESRQTDKLTPLAHYFIFPSGKLKKVYRQNKNASLPARMGYVITLEHQTRLGLAYYIYFSTYLCF